MPTEALAYRSASDLTTFDGSEPITFAVPTIRLRFFESTPVGLGPEQVDAALTAATKTWNEQACTNLDLSYDGATSEPPAPGDGRNTIAWISDWKARGFSPAAPGLTDVQYVKEPGGRWRIAEADTYLNADFDWTTGIPTGDRKSLVAVLTHEFGHLFGLLHVCEIDGSDEAPKCSASSDYLAEEMYPIYSAGQTVLSNDDIAGLCFLYPATCNDSSCPDGEACTATGCQPLCGQEVCATGFACSSAKCVPLPNRCGPTGCVGQACASDKDCAEHEFCDGSVCARGDQPLGDPCSSAQQCLAGACVDGACAQSCFPGESCESGGTCEADAGVCTDELGPMGTRCAYSSDCRGGYCLAETDHTPVCSRSCGDEQPACPSGWSCATVESSRVCTPALKADGGCALSVPSPASNSPYALLLGVASIVSWRQVRRRSS